MGGALQWTARRGRRDADADARAIRIVLRREQRPGRCWSQLLGSNGPDVAWRFAPCARSLGLLQHANVCFELPYLVQM